MEFACQGLVAQHLSALAKSESSALLLTPRTPAPPSPKPVPRYAPKTNLTWDFMRHQTVASDPALFGCSYLHRLPGEIRNRIYRYVVCYRGNFRLQLIKQPNIAHAYPDLAREINSIFFAENRFLVEVYRSDRPSNKLSAAFHNRKNFKPTLQFAKLDLDGTTFLRTEAGKTLGVRNIKVEVMEKNGDRVMSFFLSIGDAKKGDKLRVTHGRSHVLASVNTLINVRDLVSGFGKRVRSHGYTVNDLDRIADVCAR